MYAIHEAIRHTVNIKEHRAGYQMWDSVGLANQHIKLVTEYFVRSIPQLLFPLIYSLCRIK